MTKLISNTKLGLGTYFITGTDTDVGKTICTKALLQAANKQNRSTLAFKPISAGCEETAEGLRNQDALILQQNSSIKVEYEAVNPIAYKQPITRGAIEDIRGVAVSSAIMKTLLERNWIDIVGYKEVPGRPALYATTQVFLDYFSLETLSDLPEPLSIEKVPLTEFTLSDDT